MKACFADAAMPERQEMLFSKAIDGNPDLGGLKGLGGMDVNFFKNPCPVVTSLYS
jgi:hypothetical protein